MSCVVLGLCRGEVVFRQDNRDGWNSRQKLPECSERSVGSAEETEIALTMTLVEPSSLSDFGRR